MGIVTHRHRLEESGDHLLVGLFVHVLEELGIAFGDGLFGRAEGVLVEALLQEFGLDAVGPEFVGLLHGGGPGGLLPVDLDCLGAGEVVRVGGELLVLGDPFLDALAVPGEDLPRRGQLSAGNVGGERAGETLVELVHVILGEIEMHVVEHLEVVLENALRHGLRRIGLRPGRILL